MQVAQIKKRSLPRLLLSLLLLGLIFTACQSNKAIFKKKGVIKVNLHNSELKMYRDLSILNFTGDTIVYYVKSSQSIISRNWKRDILIDSIKSKNTYAPNFAFYTDGNLIVSYYNEVFSIKNEKLNHQFNYELDFSNGYYENNFIYGGLHTSIKNSSLKNLKPFVRYDIINKSTLLYGDYMDSFENKPSPLPADLAISKALNGRLYGFMAFYDTMQVIDNNGSIKKVKLNLLNNTNLSRDGLALSHSEQVDFSKSVDKIEKVQIVGKNYLLVFVLRKFDYKNNKLNYDLFLLNDSCEVIKKLSTSKDDHYIVIYPYGKGFVIASKKSKIFDLWDYYE